jgi:hypothetical protein
MLDAKFHPETLDTGEKIYVDAGASIVARHP